jgi:hypothetical protein
MIGKGCGKNSSLVRTIYYGNSPPSYPAGLNMRIAFFFIVLTFVSGSCQPVRAQADDRIRFILEAGTSVFTFSKSQFHNHQLRLPVRSVEVSDVRFDRSKTGYLDHSCEGTRYCKIKPGKDWTPLLNQYFSQNLDSASPYRLLIVIRSFWLQEGILPEINQRKIIQKDWLTEWEWGGFCKAALDIYIRTDSVLQPLFKIEDRFLNYVSFNPSRMNEFFFLPFDSVARKLMQTDLPRQLAGRRKLDPKEVDEFYQKRFLHPVLQDSLLRQGIFYTFSDFLANRPVKEEVRISRGNLTDELYIRNTGGESLVSDYWGIYDGNSLYIRSAYNLFPALRVEKSFEIYGTRQLENRHNAPQPGDLIRVNKMTMRRKILQVDMESGNLY